MHVERYVEICYLYKYGEMKKFQNMYPWVIRQTGIYHQYDMATARSVWILVSPMPSSLAEHRLLECMEKEDDLDAILKSPMLLHTFIIGTYLHFWRDYCSYYEEKLQRIVSVHVHLLD
jgi:hypothetical protein